MAWTELTRTKHNRKTDGYQRDLTDEARHTITGDFHKLWADPDTPNRERKRLIAHIIEDVTLVKLPAEGTTKVHVRFKGGKLQTLTIPSPRSAAQQLKTQPGIIQLVDTLLDNHIYSEIAELLNQQGHKPGEAALRGRSDARFTAKRVAYLVHQYNLRSRYDRLRERGAGPDQPE